MVSTEMFKENRQKIVVELNNKNFSEGFAFFQGGSNIQIYDTDCEYLFRQESTFMYLFGINEPCCYGAICLANSKSYLFIPRLNESYEVWQGHIKTPDEYKNIYDVDHVYYSDEIEIVLLSENNNLFVMSDKNKISGNQIQEVKFNGIEKFIINDTILYNIVCNCRAIKTQRELNLMRFINLITVEAHMYVMQQAKYCKVEKDLEAEFLYYIERVYGCRYVSYTCVCCTGKNSAILHYGHAGAPLSRKINKQEILLLDMGAEYYGYDSDITSSYPSDGKFTDLQANIYNAVLETQRLIESNIKAGVSWTYLQKICKMSILEHLIKLEIVLQRDKTLEDLIDLKISDIFFPHSFGHYLGLDTHDVREGYPQYDQNVNSPTSRDILLKANMVITNEPGIYFIDKLIENALNNPNQSIYLNIDVLNKYREFGGVRLEDDIVVLDNCCENMTVNAGLIKEIDQIEKHMSSPPPNLAFMCKECV